MQVQVLGRVSEKLAGKVVAKLKARHRKRDEALKEVKRQVKAKDERIKDLEEEVILRVKAKDALIKDLKGEVSNLESEILILEEDRDYWAIED